MATSKKVAKKKVAKKAVKKAAAKTSKHQVRSKGVSRFRAGVMFTSEAQDYELTPKQLAAVEADPELIIS